MGNICGAAPSKHEQDQPLDRKSEQAKKMVSIILVSTNFLITVREW